jgi:glycosyltransferase involved in cell wall biosynthesis
MKKLPTKPTVTIGISAHNEERNIGSLLDSLRTQVTDTYMLNSITILCDGCTDGTAFVVKRYAEMDSRVNVIDDGNRFGKIGRLNWLCKTVSSDVLVIFDADIRIDDSRIVEKMIAELGADTVGLVAGLQVPEPARNFWETIFVTWETIWIETRKNINEGISIHNIAGCNFAMKRSFYTNVFIPREFIAEDEFLYFEAQKQGIGFRFIPNALVYYRLPNTLHEYFMQSARFITTRYKISEHFGKVVVNRAYAVPLSKKLRALMMVGVQIPISTITAVLLQIPVRLYARFFPTVYRANVWEIATSTKL